MQINQKHIRVGACGGGEREREGGVLRALGLEESDKGRREELWIWDE